MHQEATTPDPVVDQARRDAAKRCEDRLSVARNTRLTRRVENGKLYLVRECTACGWLEEHETDPRLELQVLLLLEDSQHEHWVS